MCCKRLARNTSGRKKSPSAHHRTILSGYIFVTKAGIDNRKKKLVKQHYLPHMSLQYGELRPLMAEIHWRVWGTPTNFNQFRILAALLHGTLVVGVSQTLRRSTEGATYIRQGAITLGTGSHSSYCLHKAEQTTSPRSTVLRAPPFVGTEIFSL